MCGIMIALSGAIVSCGAFFTRKSEMFWLNLFRGSLYCVIGFMIVSKPSSTQNALGMIVSAVMLVEGIFEVTPFIIFGGRKRMIRTLIGAYAIIAGVAIWATWPSGLATPPKFCQRPSQLTNVPAVSAKVPMGSITSVL